MDLWLIVGLGNPGPKYAATRHNLGFRVLDVLAARHALPLDKRQNDARLSLGRFDGSRVVLAKPQTFMNLSGRAVRGILGWFKLAPQNLAVIYDDLDLPFGRIRIRERGSAGGHRGVQSIIESLGSDEFVRIRIGIDRPPSSHDTIDYVLQPFRADEESALMSVCEDAADAAEYLVAQGVLAAMNKFNRAGQNPVE